MSVFKLAVRDFAAIASAIRYITELRDKFLTLREIGELTIFNAYPPSEADLDNKILCWIERLYIANSLAYCYQYGAPIEIKRLRPEDLNGKMLDLKKLYKLLRTLRYNLYTNAGNSFAAAEDLEKLSMYINLLNHYITIKVIA